MIKIRKKREVEEVNSSSMADIAFLLLIFFLVTTTMEVVMGIEHTLPPAVEEDAEITPQLARNTFVVKLRTADGIVLAGTEGNKNPIPVSDLKDLAKRFLSNNGKDPLFSVSPQKAVISLQPERDTDFKTYLATLDQLQAAYNELRAEKLKISIDEYLMLDKKDPEDNALLELAAKEYPFTLSEAELNN